MMNCAPKSQRLLLCRCAVSSFVAGAVVLGAVSVQAAPIDVTVDWKTVTGKATKYSYSLNIFQGVRSDVVGNRSYINGMKYLRPGLMRYHHARMLDDSRSTPEGWVLNPDTAAYAWDRAKIARTVAWTYPGFRSDRMMNIPGFPAYMRDASGRLKPEHYTDYANFCADLVRIVNQEMRQPIRYWEITNELDNNAYATNEVGTGRGMDEVGKIYRQVAAAMRKIDPNIKIGGPAISNPYNTKRLRAFLTEAYSQLDFVSFHSYSSFQPFNPASDPKNAGIWQSAENRANVTNPVRSSLQHIAQFQGARDIELFHNEFNISGNYRLNDPRMKDERGMIYDALALAAIANSGIKGALAWNEADGIYGKLAPTGDGNWTKRPATHVFNLYNRYFKGDIVKTSAPTRVLDPGKVIRGEVAANKVTTFGVLGRRSKALALINRSGQDQEVRVFWGARPKLYAYTASRDGLTQRRVRMERSGTIQRIPKDIVLFLVQPYR